MYIHVIIVAPEKISTPADIPWRLEWRHSANSTPLHVLWECSAYSSSRACFIKKLQELLEDEYEDFESLDKVEKSSYVLGSELWESKFDGLLSLVKEYIIDVLRMGSTTPFSVFTWGEEW